MKQSVYITAIDVCITALDVGWRQTPQVFPFLSSVDAGLMPHGLSALANLVQAGSPLVPEGSAWLLLLALFLLLALAKNDSEWACYLQLLPCPLNAKGMCVYPSGPSTPHLLFFSAAELDELQYEPVKVATLKERDRLAALHCQLFGHAGNTVDLGSFMWAHCLVRSRAISPPSSIQAAPPSHSSAGSADQSLDKVLQCGGSCLVPVVDMCNHTGQGGSAHLVWGQQHQGHRTVELVAKQQHQPGEEVTLDYGCHPLQHMLYQYGFMPGHGTEGAVYEVFEDFGSMWEVLIVQASQQGGVLSLKEVKLQPSSLSSPNASLACATSMHSKDQSIIYIIDNCINSTDACSTKVTWPDCVPESPQAGVQGDAQSGPDMHPTQHQCRKLEPAQERAISVRIAAECQQLLNEMSTTIEQDKQQLMTTGRQQLAHMPWKHAEHQELALKYRIARKQTLYTVIQDLEAIVCLLFADDMLDEGKSMLC
ncbi:TPA: hypothetical protein ACH3X3_004309 [Trebouxia sp. C0006]